MDVQRESTKYDKAVRRKSFRKGRERGIRIFIPAAELRKAGIDPDGPEPDYLLHGYKRSASGHTVMVSLYA